MAEPGPSERKFVSRMVRKTTGSPSSTFPNRRSNLVSGAEIPRSSGLGKGPSTVIPSLSSSMVASSQQNMTRNGSEQNMQAAQSPANGRVYDKLSDSTTGRKIATEVQRERALANAHRIVDEADLPILSINEVLIDVVSIEEVQSMGFIRITKPLSNASVDTNVINPTEMDYDTVNDPRMGPTENNLPCPTCPHDNLNCPGHPGYIKLTQPLLHPQFIRPILQVLTCVCNSCGGLLVTKEEMRAKGLLRLTGKNRLKALEEMCRKLDSDKAMCRKKLPPSQSQEGEGEETVGEIIRCGMNPKFTLSADKNAILVKARSRGKKSEEDDDDKGTPMSALEIKKIFDWIPEEDVTLMGFDMAAHPSRMILEAVIVIPNRDRPPTFRDHKKYQHELTELYNKIVIDNNHLQRLIETGPTQKSGKGRGGRRKDSKPKTQSEVYNDLFIKVKALIDNSKGEYVTQRGRAVETIKQILHGKEGIIRGLSMGKRVNYAARTVIGSDPTLETGQLGVPIHIARVTTIPEVVTYLNRDWLQSLLNPLGEDGQPDLNQPSRINHIIPKGGQFAGRRILVGPRERLNHVLRIGDTVERWLMNGDHVLFNRQPSLHKYSMMGYETVIREYKNYGLPPQHVTAHNADFDGDEGTIHVPQSLDALVEIMETANSKSCIMNLQTGRSIIGAVYDTLSGSYALTQPTTKLEPGDLDNYILSMMEVNQIPSLADRLRKYGISPLSGSALFSALLPADFFYTKKNDDNVVEIKEGILVRGVIGKPHIGNEHNSIIQALWNSYGMARTANFLTDLTRIVNEWLITFGLSVGLDNCLPKNEDHRKIVENEIQSARMKIEALGSRPEDPLELEAYEKKVVAMVRDVRNVGLKLLKEQMEPLNPMVIMARSGAKGSEMNVAQIAGLGGQVFLYGKRPAMGLTRGTRCQPYYDPGDESLEARGFLVNSFLTGMNPSEAVFLQYTGREGLIDTATKTAETGDIHNRLVKLFEDLRVEYDGSVRTSAGSIIQYTYEDGFDPAELQNVSTRTGRVPMFADIPSIIRRANGYFSS